MQIQKNYNIHFLIIFFKDCNLYFPDDLHKYHFLSAHNMCFCFSEFWIKNIFKTTYYNSLVGIIFSVRFLSICLCVRKHIHTQLSKKSITLLPPAYKNVNAAHRTAWKTDKNIFTARLVSFDCLSNDFVFICTKW